MEDKMDELEQRLRAMDKTFDRIMEKMDNISKMLDDLKIALDGKEGN